MTVVPVLVFEDIFATLQRRSSDQRLFLNIDV